MYNTIILPILLNTPATKKPFIFIINQISKFTTSYAAPIHIYYILHREYHKKSQNTCRF